MTDADMKALVEPKENLCPTCGRPPTYQTPDGTYWDSYAHFWRVPATPKGEDE